MSLKCNILLKDTPTGHLISVVVPLSLTLKDSLSSHYVTVYPCCDCVVRKQWIYEKGFHKCMTFPTIKEM